MSRLALVPGLYWWFIRRNPGGVFQHLLYSQGVILWWLVCGISTGLEPVPSLLALSAAWYASTAAYEVGYFYNDTTAIRYENKANQRSVLTPNSITRLSFLSLRALALLTSIAVLIFALKATASGLIVAALCAGILTAYFWHNTREKSHRVASFALLRFFRYYIPAVVLGGGPSFQIQFVFFSLTFGIIESMHYFQVSSETRKQLLVLAFGIGFIATWAIVGPINAFTYPLSLVAATSFRDRFRRAVNS